MTETHRHSLSLSLYLFYYVVEFLFLFWKRYDFIKLFRCEMRELKGFSSNKLKKDTNSHSRSLTHIWYMSKVIVQRKVEENSIWLQCVFISQRLYFMVTRLYIEKCAWSIRRVETPHPIQVDFTRKRKANFQIHSLNLVCATVLFLYTISISMGYTAPSAPCFQNTGWL